MLYVNPWADCLNFIDLGSAVLSNGKSVDLYALKDHYLTGRNWYNIGVRYSNDPSDYGSGFSVQVNRNNITTQSRVTEGAKIAISRLVSGYIKHDVVADQFPFDSLVYDDMGMFYGTLLD